MGNSRGRYVRGISAWVDIVTGNPIGTVTPPPPPTASRDSLVPGDYMPTASTVGPVPGTTFTIVNAKTTASVANQVWDGYDFRDELIIANWDQTFRNCIIRGNPPGTTRSVGVKGHSNVGGGLGRAKFIDCQFIQATPNLWLNAVNNGQYTLTRCEINGWVDGCALTGALSGTTIEGCWIHNGYWGSWTPGDPDYPAQEDGQTHSDAIQIHRGKNITIRGNYIGGQRIAGNPLASDDYNNASIMINQVGSTAADKVENVLIEKNWFEGSASNINVSPANGNTFATLTIRNNRFARRTSGNYIIRNGMAGVVSGNVFDDTGLPIPVAG